jgi:hypothetical protein
LSEDTPHQEFLSWYDAIASDPEYYTNTERGQKELAEMIRRESERLMEEIGKTVKRTKEIVWFSKHCLDCRFFEGAASRMRCIRWDVRLVKPFYGRPIWGTAPSKTERNQREPVVEGIDWSTKWIEISDLIVERATDLVNGGYPYSCFTSR